MNKGYTQYNNVTREILDTIKVGDLIKINDWRKPMRVKAVSENFFVMTQKAFGKILYSVGSKLPREEGNHNAMVKGMFHCGPDFWSWGSDLCIDYDNLYEFENEEANNAYLQSFESGESELSERRSVPIYNLSIKKGKKR